MSHSNSSDQHQPDQQSYIILAAGGTGGHIFPARALAMILKEQGDEVVLYTDKRQEQFSQDDGLDIQLIDATRISGNIVSKFKGLVSLIQAMRHVHRLFKARRPDVVVGFGGYPSMATVLMASFMGIPLVLHEQNAVLGMVNRLVAQYARYIATSFKKTQLIKPHDQPKITCVGTPVRDIFKPFYEDAYHAPSTKEPFHILVVGGSQGANILGRRIPEAISKLPKPYKERLIVDQQARPEDVDRVMTFYQSVAIEASVAPFFQDMDQRYKRAHLVISRSGASTVFELAVMGRPSYLIPYKWATNNHQAHNASFLEEHGAARVVDQEDLDAHDLCNTLIELMDQPEILEKMAKAAHSVAVIDADKQLAELVGRVIEQEQKSKIMEWW